MNSLTAGLRGWHFWLLAKLTFTRWCDILLCHIMHDGNAYTSLCYASMCNEPFQSLVHLISYLIMNIFRFPSMTINVSQSLRHCRYLTSSESSPFLLKSYISTLPWGGQTTCCNPWNTNNPLLRFKIPPIHNLPLFGREQIPLSVNT